MAVDLVADQEPVEPREQPSQKCVDQEEVVEIPGEVENIVNAEDGRRSRTF